MEIQTVQANVIRQLCEALKDVITSNVATFVVDEEGIKLSELFNDDSTLVDMFLSRSGFEKFRVDGEYLLSLGLKEFYKYLRQANTSECTLTLSAKSKHADELTLSVQHKNNTGPTTFHLPIKDRDYTPRNIPPILYTNTIETTPPELNRILKSIGLVSDRLRIKTTSLNEVCFMSGNPQEDKTHGSRCKHVETGNANNVLTGGATAALSKKGGATQSPTRFNWNDPKWNNHIDYVFPLQIIVRFLKGAGKSPYVRLHLREPNDDSQIRFMCIEYAVSNLGRVQLCITPYEEEATSEDEQHAVVGQKRSVSSASDTLPKKCKTEKEEPSVSAPVSELPDLPQLQEVDMAYE